MLVQRLPLWYIRGKDFNVSTIGMAQGSVIAPLHYLGYINSLANIIRRSEMYQYADGTCLVAEAKVSTNL